MIPIGKVGKVIEGEEKGWFIKIEPDNSETKGYYIFLCKNHTFIGGLGEGYDDWVDSYESLVEYFKDEDFLVEWENQKHQLYEHPFYLRVHQARDSLPNCDEKGEWQEVKNLKVGDQIRLSSGKWAKILEVKFKGKGQVHNFSGAENHNYLLAIRDF